MNLTMREVDHLVYSVPDLEEAVNWFEEQTGVRPKIGGKHLTKGTKNALVNLGNKVYLELISADVENCSFKGKRWMGVDKIKTPTMTRWSLKSNDLETDSEALRNFNPLMGEVESGQRQTTSGEMLSWKMTLPVEEPLIEIIPFTTDWNNSDFHPTDRLPAQCGLKSLKLYHPTPQVFDPTFYSLNINKSVKYGKETRIKVEIDTPKGLLVLE